MDNNQKNSINKHNNQNFFNTHNNFELDFLKYFKIFILSAMLISGFLGYIFSLNKDKYYKSVFLVSLNNSVVSKNIDNIRISDLLNSLLYDGRIHSDKLSSNYIIELYNNGYINNKISDVYATGFSPNDNLNFLNLNLTLDKRIDKNSALKLIDIINNTILSYNYSFLKDFDSNTNTKIDKNFNFEKFINDAYLLNEIQKNDYNMEIINFRKKYKLFHDKIYSTIVYKTLNNSLSTKLIYQNAITDLNYLISINKISVNEQKEYIKYFYDKMLKIEENYKKNNDKLSIMKDHLLPFIEIKNADNILLDANKQMESSVKAKYVIMSIITGGVLSCILCLLYMLLFMKYNPILKN